MYVPTTSLLVCVWECLPTASFFRFVGVRVCVCSYYIPVEVCCAKCSCVCSYCIPVKVCCAKCSCVCVPTASLSRFVVLSVMCVPTTSLSKFVVLSIVCVQVFQIHP